MQDLEQRFTRLVERVLEEGVVPFLGASFSYGAWFPNGEQSQHDRMSMQLNAYLSTALKGCRAAPSPDAGSEQWPPECAAHCSPESRSFCTIRRSNPKSLALLAELVGLAHGTRTVCDVLKIADYAELRPQDSHRYLAYLAYLAREGLIREVITTNYDCCIEWAFDESRRPASAMPMGSPGDDNSVKAQRSALGRDLEAF
ncbi:hypothetical protein SAMN04488038_1209 [Solimonas aquatica]|uniref:SIR2-like domain-containing protein n=1 Tax=Solimonas aquatica TaxID=489703 RepID=A0A1H9M9M4_9GAMM|nr:hypothetical protein [Solimonas aquatica]SER20169.1 hypothetical protein SAMN04488038_1209 [Solimonas aquatica]